MEEQLDFSIQVSSKVFLSGHNLLSGTCPREPLAKVVADGILVKILYPLFISPVSSPPPFFSFKTSSYLPLGLFPGAVRGSCVHLPLLPLHYD